MFDLSDDQRLELSDPVPMAVDPVTKSTYVLIRSELYERVKWMLARDDFDPDQAAGAVNETMADDDVKDPYLDSYQHYGTSR